MTTPRSLAAALLALPILAAVPALAQDYGRDGAPYDQGYGSDNGDGGGYGAPGPGSGRVGQESLPPPPRGR